MGKPTQGRQRQRGSRRVRSWDSGSLCHPPCAVARHLALQSWLNGASHVPRVSLENVPLSVDRRARIYEIRSALSPRRYNKGREVGLRATWRGGYDLLRFWSGRVV